MNKWCIQYFKEWLSFSVNYPNSFTSTTEFCWTKISKKSTSCNTFFKYSMKNCVRLHSKARLFIEHQQKRKKLNTVLKGNRCIGLNIVSERGEHVRFVHFVIFTLSNRNNFKKCVYLWNWNRFCWKFFSKFFTL